MARDPELKHPCIKTINFEYQDYVKFTEIVGANNVSRQIRAMVANFLKQQTGKQTTFDEIYQEKSMDQFLDLNIPILSRKIHNIKDYDDLEDLHKKIRIVKSIINTRKENIQKQFLAKIKSESGI